ncbi:hypothetical protein WA026_001294 [Henosepilachna vigintioctopunctata]|uniref:Histone-lysine N-methyltransferase SETMAR n=1 Tax=Henosepilachna vigintioctopunctata TaxID=420089 RepID=A0AAW1UHW1_9CUCU
MDSTLLLYPYYSNTPPHQIQLWSSGFLNSKWVVWAALTRPVEVTTSEMIEKIHQILMEDSGLEKGNQLQRRHNFIGKHGYGYCVFGMREELHILIIQKRVRLSLSILCRLFHHLKNKVQIKRSHLEKKKFSFHHDNAPAHSFIVAISEIDELKFELTGHRPYSSDLVPKEHYLFRNLKNALAVKDLRATKNLSKL